METKSTCTQNLQDDWRSPGVRMANVASWCLQSVIPLKIKTSPSGRSRQPCRFLWLATTITTDSAWYFVRGWGSIYRGCYSNTRTNMVATWWSACTFRWRINGIFERKLWRALDKKSGRLGCPFLNVNPLGCFLFGWIKLRVRRSDEKKQGVTC